MICPTTNQNYSPWDQLPSPIPIETTYSEDYFYHNTVKHLVKDVVRVMDNGLHVDLEKVHLLEQELEQILAEVESQIADNPLVQEYLKTEHAGQIKKYIKEQTAKLRTSANYETTFKPGDAVHRSYFMYVYANRQKMEQPSELLPTGIPKWPANLVKKFASTNLVLKKLLDKSISVNHPIALEAMQLLAEHKAKMYNEKYLTNIHNPTDKVKYPIFNPASSAQKQQFFQLNEIDSDEFSATTGLPSYNRKQIERINKEYTDEHIVSLTNALIEHSYAAIVKNNFIEAFYNYTVDNRLYGSLKLFGAKSLKIRIYLITL